MIPIRDENPTTRTPVVTIGLIAINVLVFVLQMLQPPEAQQQFVFAWGAIPRDIAMGWDFLPAIPIAWLTLFTSMFMHGGLMHLGGNMLYLWIFGNNIEDRLGHVKFLVFYLIGGLVAALSHVFFAPSSEIPMVGASGAISAVLGAYIVAYPQARVIVLFWIVVFVRFIRAYLRSSCSVFGSPCKSSASQGKLVRKAVASHGSPTSAVSLLGSC